MNLFHETRGQFDFDHFWAIIPAGGVGSRLWPLSRSGAPKFLLDLTGTGKSLLEETWSRLCRFVPAERIVVVTGVKHRDSVEKQLPQLLSENLLTEPEPKDSSAAIGFATEVILRRDPQAIVGSFAADHIVRGQVLFERAIRTAVQAAREGNIVTIGIHPTYPATGFGYIRAGEPRTDISPFDVYTVDQFVEKPNMRTAKSYIESGNSLWNAGMFITRASVLLEQMEITEPDLVRTLREIVDMREAKLDVYSRARSWRKLKKVAIDYSVAEPAAQAGKMLCVAAHFDWDDIGDFASIANVLTRGRRGDLAVLGQNGAQVLSENTNGIVIANSDRLVAVIGVDDVVVVDTDDALLVTNKSSAQDVKKLVEKLRIRGTVDTL